ncbi:MULTISPECIES: bifunctional riboflavin kinase/FAD synthetase [unclassified Gemella]|uniref:bifunctional riboflavin kinase/FAD synthetase n=1 Tax=unclassified Gemella TaxID=2624949 RepID=UPI0010730A75|nr:MULTISPECIES: bifunctional riboflavin kinase/FAD synthetase [unclassified Gemella]MBF0710270.1 bifunctional riboflavin kinase/FAD synthetase [Gemella sp. GL1.1]MBF0746302.1 bifunctional riboflavin kinase/FAD synthetase [Gemella sp. 19428wG2_WT2a]NYS27614.1 bifunctional riboflavin kinase/FAD synthetase [Gemella sp. GL1]TFU60578.1 bifunctional riboflavin kinase/FAD synthetase [Gemella sp. WT2a]
MKVFYINDMSEIKEDNIKRAVALGFFDGIHKGHRKIIENTISGAKNEGMTSCLLTFDICPKEFFSGKEIKLLTPKQRKISILNELGIDELYILKFNDKLSKISKEEFIETVLKKLNIVSVYCGEDYLFGSKGQGTPAFIEEYTKGSIKVNIVKLIKSKDNNKISSTYLRNLIIEGKVFEYKEISGVNYKISGKVKKGKQLGRTISFPTVNLELDEEYVIPNKFGVYLTKVKVKGKYYKGITNIGKNPTVSDSGNLSIETYILDFSEDIYGEKIELEFYDYLRKEQKFLGLEELKKQLLNDKALAEKFNMELSIEKK